VAPRTPFEDTSVSVERSKDQIRKFLKQAGALGVQFDEEWGDNPRMRVRFVWPLEGGEVQQVVRLDVKPLPAEKGTRGGWRVSEEQRERQAWRGLAHYLEGTIKAAVFGLIKFEDIFLSFIEAEGGLTVGEVLIPRLEAGRLALPPGD
jgi:hypothetical protein